MVDTEKLKTTTVVRKFREETLAALRNASHDHGAERTQMEVDDTLHSQ